EGECCRLAFRMDARFAGNYPGSRIVAHQQPGQQRGLCAVPGVLAKGLAGRQLPGTAHQVHAPLIANIAVIAGLTGDMAAKTDSDALYPGKRSRRDLKASDPAPLRLL